MRTFKALGQWNFGEVNVEEIGSDKRFVLTQRQRLIEEDFYTITRTVADPIDNGNMENIYIVSWLENGGAAGTVSCSKIIDHETMIDIIKNNTDDLLQGRLDLRKYFEEQKITKETNIKTWYTKEFPTDEVGKTLNNITFKEAYDSLHLGSGFYDVLGGTADSLVRERIFTMLSKLYGCSYDDIYDIWLGDD